MLAEGGLGIVKEFVQREDNFSFSLMALVQNAMETPYKFLHLI